jgi:hypothetical protein
VSDFAYYDNDFKGLRVNFNNDFDSEWNDEKQVFITTINTLCQYNLPVENNYPSSDDRGYFKNEIVEGGSLMGLRANIILPLNPSLLSTDTVYFSPKYSDTISLLYGRGASGRQIIMRSDRLPTSTTLTNNCDNSFLLQSNEQFGLFLIPSGGTVGVNYGTTPQSGGSTGASNDNDGQNFTNQLIDSSSCANSVPLGCYSYDNVTGSLKINRGSCERNYLKSTIFKNGCYLTVTVPIFSLPGDLLLLTEWSSRLNISFGACRNVWSHSFINNWVNGTLFAYSFKNNVTYSNQNKPINGFCMDTLVFHRNTRNFYYRSSPYKDSVQKFIGKNGKDIGNTKNLLYPTTMIDLGPRNEYIQEIVMSDDFDGYVVNKLNSTSYGDVSEILNLLILSRLANQSFIEQMLAGVNILVYFSRTKLNLDGISVRTDSDYSQMISINSEIGVVPFESMNYPDVVGSQNPIFINPGNLDPVFGIFFSSDTSIRDFITPKRTIINPTVNNLNECGFSNIDVFSQNVPFYQWSIKENGFSIFGRDTNEWSTDSKFNGGFFNRKYQEMDRIEPSSRYFRTNGGSQNQYFKGYIYSLSANTLGQTVLNAKPNSWSKNAIVSSDITTGAPFHFYFGLKKGKSAYDRFVIKWVDTTTIVD